MQPWMPHQPPRLLHPGQPLTPKETPNLRPSAFPTTLEVPGWLGWRRHSGSYSPYVLDIQVDGRRPVMGFSQKMWRRFRQLVRERLGENIPMIYDVRKFQKKNLGW